MKSLNTRPSALTKEATKAISGSGRYCSRTDRRARWSRSSATSPATRRRACTDPVPASFGSSGPRQETVYRSRPLGRTSATNHSFPEELQRRVPGEGTPSRWRTSVESGKRMTARIGRFASGEGRPENRGTRRGCPSFEGCASYALVPQTAYGYAGGAGVAGSGLATSFPRLPSFA
jgi:hypothetical protein